MAAETDEYMVLIEQSSKDVADPPHLILLLNLVLSGIARLNVLLPTATILAPILTDDGKCARVKEPREPEYRLVVGPHPHRVGVRDVRRLAPHDIVQWYCPRSAHRKVVNTVRLVIGLLVSLLFGICPSKRKGIGYPFLLRTDLVYLGLGNPWIIS
jgi:hypothetical protein